MPDFGVLLDAPAETAKRIQIARLGPVSDPRYGDFEITATDAEDWKTNLTELPGQRALIDFEHRSEKSPRNSEAAGWITGIDLDGSRVMADVEWSDKGEEAIRNRRYLFLSPAYGRYRNERGDTFDNTLCSVGLTNKPVLGSLPMLTLASEERVSEAIEQDPALRFHQRALDGELGDITQALVMLDVSQAERDKATSSGNSLPDGSYPINNSKQLHSAAVLAASGHGDAAAARSLIKRRAKELGVDVASLPGFSEENADSRRAMAEVTPDLLKLLDLPEDADEQTVLDTVTSLKDKADKPEEPTPEPETKTLEQQAAETGRVLLDAEKFKTLAADAAAGRTAATQLHEERRDRTWHRALEQMVRTEAQHDNYLRMYELDADATSEAIEDDIKNGRRLLNAKPIGSTEEVDANAPKTLEQRISEVVKEKALPYDEAYLHVLEEMEAGN